MSSIFLKKPNILTKKFSQRNQWVSVSTNPLILQHFLMVGDEGLEPPIRPL